MRKIKVKMKKRKKKLGKNRFFKNTFGSKYMKT